MTTSLSKIINNNGQNLFSDFDFILTNFMDSQGRYKFAESSGFPKLNLYSSETEDGKVKYTIEASITGYDKNDIDVIVDRNKLTISYNKDLDKDEEKKNYFLQEIKKSSFSRSILLSEKLDVDNPITSYSDGLLKIEFFEDIKKKSKRLTF
jgi:HSP20 family molecular chaperone IbpA